MSFARTSTTRPHSIVRLLLLPALLLCVWAFVPHQAYGQMKNDHVSWKLLTPEVKGKPGEKVDVKVKVQIVPEAHLYTTKSYPDTVLGPNSTIVTAGEKSVISRAGKVQSSKKPVVKYDDNFEMDTEYWEGTVTVTVPVRIAKNAKPGTAKGWVNFNFMTCTDIACRPSTDERLEFTVLVEEDTVQTEEPIAEVDTVDQQTAESDVDTGAAPITEVEDTGEGDTSEAVAAAAVPGDNGDIPQTTEEQIANAKKKGLLAYILLAMGFGFGALLTPCVFPMIPITVSFFTKREQKSHAHAVRDAGIYAFGIILTFTAIGAIVAALMGATGIGDIASNPYVNFFIAAIFVAFALSLFGLFEIQIPSSVLNKLNAKANEGGGVSSILLMGFVFSLTSFTCTVPFIGPSLLGIEGGEWFYPILGMLSFATAFSLPFFLLAVFPSWLKAMPKSGGWLNAVKVTMGFVEIAAAMKFLSNIDLHWQLGILTREVVLSVWIAVAVIGAMYLLGRFRLPHDTPTEKIGVARMLFSMSFLAVGLWFLTGLLGGRLGEVDAFLPPQEYPGKGNTSIFASLSEGDAPQMTGAQAENGEMADAPTLDSNQVWADGMVWYEDDYEAALKESERTGKPVFTDFTGYSCTNCRWMERNMFTRGDVRDLMNQYVLARLYTDGSKPVSKVNRQMQADRFKTIDLPLYVLVSAEDEVISKSIYTRDVDQFKNFLKRGLEHSKVGDATGELASK